MQSNDKVLAIEEVSSRNFEEFTTLISQLAEYEKLPPPDLDAKKRLKKDCLSKKPKFEAFIARKSGIAVGYLIYFFTYSSFLALPSLYLEDIFVLKEYRRQGIGKRMLDFCKTKASEKGCGRIELTVLDWNKSAQKFYEENKARRLNWYLFRVDKKDFQPT